MSVMSMPHGNRILANQSSDPNGKDLHRIDVPVDAMSLLHGGGFNNVVRDTIERPIDDINVDYENDPDEDNLLFSFDEAHKGHIDSDFPNHTFELGHRMSTDVTDMDKDFDPGILRRYSGNGTEENLLLPSPEDYQVRVVPSAIMDYFNESALSRDNVELNFDKFRSGEINYVYVTGPSGSGKSTLAHKIADECGAEIISLDIVGVALREDKGRDMLEKLKQNKVRLDPAHKSDVHPFDKEYINSHPDIPWASMESNAAHADTAYLTWLSERCPKDPDRKFVIEGSNIMYKEPEFFSNKPLVIVGTGSLKAHFRRVKRFMSRINADNWLTTIRRGAKLALDYKFSREHGKTADKFRKGVIANGKTINETAFIRELLHAEPPFTKYDDNYKPKEKWNLENYRQEFLDSEELRKTFKKDVEMLRCADIDGSVGYVDGKPFTDPYMSVIWIDDSGNKPVCVACVSVIPRRDGQNIIHAFGINPKYRGHGLARQIIEFCIERANANQISVLNGNKVAKKTYESCGFKQVTSGKDGFIMTLGGKPLPKKAQRELAESYFNEAAMKSSERNSLPDEAFGLPRLRAYPLHDKKHVQFAIRMFGHCKDPEDRKTLARNIVKAMEKFGVETKVGKANPLYEYIPETLKESVYPAMGIAVPGFDKPDSKRSNDDIVKEHLRINAPVYNQAFYGTDFKKDVAAVTNFDFLEYFYPALTNMTFTQRINCVCGGIAAPPGGSVIFSKLGLRDPLSIDFTKPIGMSVMDTPEKADRIKSILRLSGYDASRNWFKVNLESDYNHTLFCLRLYAILGEIIADPDFDPNIHLTDEHRGVLLDWSQRVEYHYDLYREAGSEKEKIKEIQYLFDMFWNFNDNPRDVGIQQVNLISLLRSMACVSNIGVNINEGNDDAEIMSKEGMEKYLINDLKLDKSYYLLPYKRKYPILDKTAVRLAMDDIRRVPRSERREYAKNLNRKYQELGCDFSISVDHPYAKYAGDRIVDNMVHMLLEGHPAEEEEPYKKPALTESALINEDAAIPTIFDILSKDMYSGGNTREDIAARKFARWRDIFFTGILGSTAAALFVRVDVVNGDIRIQGINCNLLLVRTRRVFNESRLRHIFEYHYNAASWAAFQRKAIKRGDMRIDYVYAPEFFALELVDLFLALAHTYKDASYNTIAEQIYKKTWLSRSDSEEIAELNTSKLQNLALKPLPHQERFIREWPKLKSRLHLKGYCLAFKPGYGKTLTSIALAECLDVDHVYIICPNSLKPNWASEIRKYYKKYQEDDELWKRDVCILGTGKFGNPKTARYVIVNNEGLDHLQKRIKEEPKSIVIIDECHNFRNYDSSRVKQLIDAVGAINPNDVLCVSATPIKAAPAELTPMLKLIDPLFNDTVAEMYARCFSLSRTMANELVTKRFGMTIYRPPEINLGLPEKHETVLQLPVKGPEKYHLKIVSKEVRIEYEKRRDEWRAQARVPLDEYEKEIRKYSRAPKSATRDYLDWVIAYGAIEHNSGRFHEVDVEKYRKYLETYVKPRCDAGTYERLKADERKFHNIVDSIRGKALGVILHPRRVELFSRLYTENRRVFYEAIRNCPKKTVIFTTMVKIAKLISDDLNDYGIKTVLVTGDVVKERQSLIDQFKNDPSTLVLVATVQSLGVGHTFTEASQLYFFGLPWRYADYEQAADRIYRIGQTSEVTIINVKLKSKEPNLSDRIEDIMNWSHDMFQAYVDSDTLGEEMMSESVDTVDDEGTSASMQQDLVTAKPYHKRIDYATGVTNNVLENKELGPNTKKIQEPNYTAFDSVF